MLASVSMLRKNTRSRATIFFSLCSARNASYMWNGSALARLSKTNESSMSGNPGITNAPMSTLVVTPTLAE